MFTRSQTCCSMVLEPRVARALPGNREEAYRAGITPRIRRGTQKSTIVGGWEAEGDKFWGPWWDEWRGDNFLGSWVLGGGGGGGGFWGKNPIGRGGGAGVAGRHFLGFLVRGGGRGGAAILRNEPNWKGRGVG